MPYPSLLKRGISLLYALIFLCLAGCQAVGKKESISTTELRDLRKLEAGDFRTLSISPIRYTALQDTALSLGARAGLAARAIELNRMLGGHKRALERVFNFQQIMLTDSVLPPVLIEGRNTLDITSGNDAIRIADRSYIILSQAKFVTAPPTWHDYLWLDFAAPEAPDRTLLPRNKAERIIWDQYLQQGWAAGITQADNILTESIGRLKRDFLGMIRYRTLLAQNMVSAPFVARVHMGVTGGGNALSVNDRLLRITELPTLSADSHFWKTDITQVLDLEPTVPH